MVSFLPPDVCTLRSEIQSLGRKGNANLLNGFTYIDGMEGVGGGSFEHTSKN